MNELNAWEFIDMHGTLRQRAQPGEVCAGELVARPEGGEASDWVEVFEVHQAADCFVVIAAHKYLAQFSRQGDDLIRIAAVTNCVSKIDDEIVGRSGGEASVERLEVAVNVAE